MTSYQRLSAALLAFGGLACLLHFVPFDFNPAASLADWPTDLRRGFKLAEVFTHPFGALGILIAIALLAPERRREIPCLVFIAYGAWGTCWLADHGLADAFGMHSFGHACDQAALGMGLVIGLTRCFPKGRWLFIFLVVLSSVQQCFRGGYRAEDVFAGMMFAVMWIIVMQGAQQFGMSLGRWCMAASLRIAANQRESTSS